MDTLLGPDLTPLPLAEAIDRRSGIGASMAPVVCNLVPWSGLISNPLGAYLWYTGALDRQEATEEMELGNDLEEGIGRALVRRLGRPFCKPPSRRHPTIPWLYASPDGLLSPREGVELKNVGAGHAEEWGEEGTDEVPAYYAVQCQQQCEVFGLDVVHVGALCWGNSLRVYQVERNDRAIGHLLTILEAFWRRVQRRDPPEPDWTHPATPKLIEYLHRPQPEVTVPLGDWAQLLAEDYEARGRALTALEKERAEVKGRLVAALGNAGIGLLPDGRQVVRKEVQRKGFTVEPSTYFDLRIKKGKPS